MPELRELIEEHDRVRAQAQAILEQHKNGAGFTAELNVQVTNLMAKAAELQGEIKAQRSYEEKKKDLERADEFANAPQYRIPHGVGEGEDDTRKALRQAGWEVKGGMVYAPTSLGKMQPMYGEEVVLGDLPDGLSTEERKFFETTRRAFQPDYRKAYEKHLRLLGKYHGEYAMMWTQLSAGEQKALSEGTDTAGGFLVPPDVQAELLVRIAQDAVIRGAGARVQPTSRDILRYPMVQAASPTAGGQASGADHIFSSGFVGSFAGETPAFSDTDPQFGSFDVPVKKIRVATRLSNDFISDAVVNVLAFLSQNGAENAALVEDNGFINGDGTALQPVGILSDSIPLVDVTPTPLTTHTLVNDATHQGPPQALLTLVYNVPPQYAAKASCTWIMRRLIEGEIRKYIDGNSRFHWPAYTESSFGRVEKQLMGYAIRNSDFMPNDGVADAKVIIFGDISGYIIAQRAQITSTILRERFADTDQTGIILWERVGGAVWNPDAMRVGYAHS